MEGRPVLFIDLKGTLADVFTVSAEILGYRVIGTPFEDQVKTFDMLAAKLSLNEMLKHIKNAWDKDNDAVRLVDPTIPQATKELQKRFALVIGSASPSKDEVLIKWIRKNKVTYDKFLHLDKREDKLAVPAFAYVDDDPFVIIEGLKLKKRMVVVRTPWTKSLMGKLRDENLTKCKDWLEVRNVLLKSSARKKLF